MRFFLLLVFSVALVACGSKQTSFHKFGEYLQGEEGSQSDDLNKSEDANSEISKSATDASDKKGTNSGVDIEIVDSGLSDEDVDSMMDGDDVAASEGTDGSNDKGPDSSDNGKKGNSDKGKAGQGKPDSAGKPKGEGGDYQAILWPPHHKLVLMKVVSLEQQDGLGSCSIEGIASSQKVGDDSFDYNIIDSETFALRAEREGTNKAGRTYSLSLSCLDIDQNTVTVERKVWVPHNKGQIK